MKRGTDESRDECNYPKKKKEDTSPAPSLLSPAFYFTPVRLLPDRFNSQALSLSNVLELVRPIASLHFNFMVDLSWLLSCYPVACRPTPITIIVGEKTGTDARTIRTEIAAKKLENVAIYPARLPIPFGTHHTKLTILEAAGHIHVIVSTANLVPGLSSSSSLHSMTFSGDWEAKTQLFYHVAAPIVDHDSESVFSSDLLKYLKAYNIEALSYWISRIQAADFSAITDRLVFSVPGYHSGAMLRSYGHLSLRKLLASQEKKEEKGKSVIFVAQCSSIGSLGKEINTWVRGQFLTSLNGGNSDTGSSRFFLVYPCVEDVRNSIEGYDAGCSLPYRAATDVRQPWLRHVMCKWRSEANGRSKAMPHAKTFTKLVDGTPQWMLITSGNLSKAAWGELQGNNEKLCVRSYEMGVLITDPERMKLPYDYPLVKYSKTDEPWVTDKNYATPDSCGGTWIIS
ncbi:unnamed protein product [Caenorhabditis auriculariae]|uniref:Tyrosyl-DNA phosphodiesterase n=1 Tax=Caenorhabditis auriculariae TaxID=2777116 RepID=A0A8S1H6U9_9PELO|nr:unnamed protein product [Caenorhabditis auriculariae]